MHFTTITTIITTALLLLLLAATPAHSASDNVCTIRKIPMDCFDYVDTAKTTELGDAVTFKQTASPGSDKSKRWGKLWTRVSHCQNISTKRELMRAYIFPSLNCAGDDLERFDQAVFFLKPNCTEEGAGSAFKMPLRDSKTGKILDTWSCLDPSDPKWKYNEGKPFFSVMLAKVNQNPK